MIGRISLRVWLPVALSVFLACPSSVFSEAKLLPVGTKMRTPDGEELRLDATHFLLPRGYIDRINATAEANRKLEKQLVKCADEKRKLVKESPSRLSTALTWSAVGLALAGAFYLGKSVD